MIAKLTLLACLSGLALSRPSEDSWTPSVPSTPTKLHQVKTPVDSLKKPADEGRANEDNGLFSWLPIAEYRVLSKVYGDCAERDDFTACLKGKALIFLDRASRKQQLALPGGLVLVRADGAQEKNDVALTEEQVEATLPRELGQREAQLDDMIVDRSLDFVKTHALRFDFGLNAASEAAAGDERGIKKKDILPYLLLGKLVAASMVAMAFTGLALLAGKALMVSKIALILSGIVALKKLFHHGGGGGGGGGVEVVNVPSSHGHYGRSLGDDAHNVAYRGQIQRPSPKQ